jgi:hypothetical protein
MLMIGNGSRPFLELRLYDGPVAGRVHSLRAGNSDPSAFVHRHNPNDLAILIGQERYTNRSNKGGFVPMTAACRSVGKIEHYVRQSSLFESGPDFRNQVCHESSPVLGWILCALVQNESRTIAARVPD